MQQLYNFNNKINLLRTLDDTHAGQDYERNTATATRAARALLPFVKITAGAGLLAGLAYTSTSAFAGVWNCNTSAHHRANSGAYFDGVALDEHGRAVYIWTLYENGDEIGETYTTTPDEIPTAEGRALCI